MDNLILKNKTVMLGVTGGIAAYKACDIVSRLKRLGADVNVVMTKSAQEFISPLTLETLSSNAVVTDMFAPKLHYDVEHISLAKKADIVLIAPATANIIAKLAWGLADDFLTTTILATKAPLFICPAMNTQMLCADATVNNINILKGRGAEFLLGKEGMLACGDIGSGRLADVDDIVINTVKMLYPNKDYKGKKVLISAGATVENIDGVRGITNYSSGKMGLELARAAYFRGAEVTLVCGRISVDVDIPVNRVDVTTTLQMRDQIIKLMPDYDIIIKAAAPSDYRPVEQYSGKIKGDKLTLNLVKNPDIAAEVGKIKGDKKLIIFSAETDNLIANAKSKLISKNADMVVANDITKEGAGFGTDTNIIEIIYKDKTISLPKASKSTLSHIILDHAKGI